jgi:hypothetical protein
MDRESHEVVRIRRQQRIPPRFEMIQSGGVVGTIALRSPLRTRYTLAFSEGPTWFFRMPLFTVLFQGESNSSSRLWVQVAPSEKQWNVLIEPGADDLRLLASLAFIQRERWSYS